MFFFKLVFRNTPDIHSFFHNSLSCLVSHPDETLRKRLKEKRKGGLCFCSLLHFTTALISTLVCMNEHEPCELCLSIITHQSANTWPQSTSSSPLTAVQLKEGKKQRRNINLPLYVLMSTTDQPRGMSALVFIVNEEWFAVCPNYFSCLFILLSPSSNSNFLLYASVSQTFSVLGPVL